MKVLELAEKISGIYRNSKLELIQEIYRCLKICEKLPRIMTCHDQVGPYGMVG